MKQLFYTILFVLIPLPSLAQLPVEDVDYVDLGLESGTLWATMNVGAKEVADYGGYYAWGETEEKAVYYWSTYFDSVNGSSINFNTYRTDGETSIIYTDHDVAKKVMGKAFQMPTLDQWYELKESCTWKCDTVTSLPEPDDEDGTGKKIPGYRVTGPNGNSIFLPSAGSKYGSNCEYQGRYFYYWAGELYYLYDEGASSSLGCYMDASFNNSFAYYGSSRNNGYPVRAVVNQKYLPGDANVDGVVNLEDVSTVAACILKKTILSGVGADNADADCDGTVDMGDLTWIVQTVIEENPEPARASRVPSLYPAGR